MLLVLLPVAVGLAVGLLWGGSWRGLAEAGFRWWPLALVGLALQVVPVPSDWDEWVGPALLLASYVVLLGFVAANLRRPGFALIAAGFVLNALAISLNGGMPVSDWALRRASGPEYEETRQRLVEEGGAKHHLADEDDVLRPITDVIPLGWPFRQVLSVGDLVWLAGTGWAVAGATRARGAGSSRSPAVPPSGPSSAKNPARSSSPRRFGEDSGANESP